MTPLLSVEHLTGGYGRRTVVRDVSFTVERGKCSTSMIMTNKPRETQLSPPLFPLPGIKKAEGASRAGHPPAHRSTFCSFTLSCPSFYPIMLSARSYASTDIEARIKRHRSKDK